MPAVVRLTDESAGHACWPPTTLVTTPVQKTYINGLKAGVMTAQYAPHTCTHNDTHSGGQRAISSGSEKTFIEGYAVARIGDSVADGDVCAQGSENTFVG